VKALAIKNEWPLLPKLSKTKPDKNEALLPFLVAQYDALQPLK
jgi:hypothetical protein